MTPPATGVPWLAVDPRRNLCALATAVPVAVLAVVAYSLAVPVRFTVDTVALTVFVFWIAYSLVWLILTHWVFGRVDAKTLRGWLVATTPEAGRMPTVNVQWSILATASVGLVIVLPGLISSPLANALSVFVVLSAWLVTVSTYAVHYARLNAVEDAVEFPGKAVGPVFTDYYYLAAQIATTFSSSDVTILTTRSRAVVTGQTYISFAFSTFIIALLITVLFLG
ncbi:MULTISPECIES: DUF1345 domain-containing protein [unclassified Microbacterium]|uniref:DUF1345 domain-containing protein n=1 Tax=unclassified Microbacterium TaxID=2609290 RepID=UPI00214BAF25|nr:MULTISPECIES: DUF1345 domain-containing protein [unclassified Microbacterium]MCR2784562.1 DUF1345 domain-containing protein [Microbacterium sp. zg.B96]MDL5350519.1 DUF1345 domain-containing protein [Microbacterium sp. zg-YB36]WIM14628.1 DUF1345 domain-containing protein [Microbacterium sp. zg-B96]